MKNTNCFYFKPCEKSDKLIIIFSSRNVKKFDCFKLLENYPINQLFVRDENSTWYQESVEGHWEDADDMIKKIRAISDNFHSKNVLCMGGSMGGYAAILVAIKLNFSKALAFSPQMVLDHRLPNNPSPELTLKYPNCYNLIKNKSNVNIKIFCGTEDFSDLFSVYPSLNYKEIDVDFIYGAAHRTMGFLKREQLIEIVLSFIEGRDSLSIFPQLPLFNHITAYKDICQFVQKFYFENEKNLNLILLLDKISEYYPDWSAVHFYKGLVYFKNSNFSEAIKSFMDSIKFTPFKSKLNHEIFYYLGESYIRINNYEKAEEMYRKALEYIPKIIPNYLCKLGISVMLQGNDKNAIEIQKQVIKEFPNYHTAYYQLGLLMNRTKHYAEAIPFFEEAHRLGNKHPNLEKHLNTAKKNKV